MLGLSEAALLAVNSLCPTRVLHTFQSFTVKGSLLSKCDKANVKHYVGGGFKDSVPIYLSFPFLTTALHVQPCSVSSLLADFGKGVVCEELHAALG